MRKVLESFTADSIHELRDKIEREAKYHDRIANISISAVFMPNAGGFKHFGIVEFEKDE